QAVRVDRALGADPVAARAVRLTERAVARDAAVVDASVRLARLTRGARAGANTQGGADRIARARNARVARAAVAHALLAGRTVAGRARRGERFGHGAGVRVGEVDRKRPDQRATRRRAVEAGRTERRDRRLAVRVA